MELDTPKMSHEEMIDTLKGLVFGTFDRTTVKEREALDMAIALLEQKPCDDCVSRQSVLDIDFKRIILTTAKPAETIEQNVKALSSVQPTVCIAKISFDDQQMKEMMDKAISNLEFSDLISRQDAIEQSIVLRDISNPDKELEVVTVATIKHLKSVQPARKIGRWIKQTLSVKPFGEDIVLCDQCAFMTDKDNTYNYCPNCGAKMGREET